jgi:hypothetical protein
MGIKENQKKKKNLVVQAAAMTGGNGSPPTGAVVLCATGLPWSSGESSDSGAGGATATTGGASLAAFAARLDFLPVFDAPSSTPARFFFFERSPTGRSSSEVTVWLPAVDSVGGAGGAWPVGVGMGPYAPGGG